MWNISDFGNFSLEKMDFLARKNVAIFEKWIHFLRLWIVFKNETSLPSGGPSPPDPLRWRLPSRFPLIPLNQYPGADNVRIPLQDSTRFLQQIFRFHFRFPAPDATEFSGDGPFHVWKSIYIIRYNVYSSAQLILLDRNPIIMNTWSVENIFEILPKTKYKTTFYYSIVSNKKKVYVFWRIECA